MITKKPSRLPCHYGWLIVATGTLTIFACLGLGRFAFGMLLPSMGNALNLSYSQMGWVSTANFIGYLVAVILASTVVQRLGTRGTLFGALLLIAASMALISRVQNCVTLAMLYTFTGIGSGMANVPTMALVAAWFDRTKRGRAAGFVVIGSGFAILLAGNLIPYCNQMDPAAGWRHSWLILALAVLAVAFVSLAVIRDRPSLLGLKPVGSEDEGKGPNAFAPSGRPEPAHLGKTVLHMGAIYFLFGFTYVIYATFIVTTLVKEKGFTEAAAGGYWAWVGFFSLFSGPVFGTLSDYIGRRRCLMLVFCVQATAYFLAAATHSPFLLFLSMACYGLVAWSIPSIMAALVGDHFGPEKTAKIFGIITFIFGIGQITGPALAGAVAQRIGGFTPAFFAAMLLAVAAVVLSARLPEERVKPAPGQS